MTATVAAVEQTGHRGIFTERTYPMSRKPGSTWGGGGNESCFEMVAAPLLVMIAIALHVFGG